MEALVKGTRTARPFNLPLRSVHTSREDEMKKKVRKYVSTVLKQTKIYQSHDMNLPGKMSAMAVAEPVDVGAKLTRAERARRRSDFFVLGASTTVCVLVTLCTVVMHPCLIPNFS